MKRERSRAWSGYGGPEAMGAQRQRDVDRTAGGTWDPSRGTLVAGTLALLAGAALAVTAAAHTTSSPTSLAITLPPSESYVYGTVSSPKAACEPDRRVRLLRKRQGDDKLIAADRSFDAGSGVAQYTVDSPDGEALNAGSYYSQVKRIDLAAGSAHDHLCNADRSARVTVGKP
jgi:hypothetical protein